MTTTERKKKEQTQTGSNKSPTRDITYLLLIQYGKHAFKRVHINN